MEHDRRTAISIPSERPHAVSPRLVVIAGPHIGRQFELGEDAFVIGRGDDATFRVDSDLISRRHVAIQRFAGKYLVNDCRSTNGTYVNDVRITAQELTEGDLIRVGKVVMRYSESEIEAEYQRKMHTMVSSDALTGLYNKRYFDEALSHEVERCHSGKLPLSLIIFDIDHFKKINDTHGHPAGDAVLKEVARNAQRMIDEGSSLCRVGGEEFAVIVPKTDLNDAKRAAEQIRVEVAGCDYHSDSGRVVVTMSAGVAQLASDEPPDELYRRADEQLYRAKRAGRNQVH
jgi:diguanylate cyclase (GGDEF)-like protein